MTEFPVRVTRDVTKDDQHNYLGRDVKAGEIFYLFRGHTYGCVRGPEGIALSERANEYPFFEFPADAIEEV